MFLIEWFDIGWFWLGRITGCMFIFAFAVAIALEIFTYIWGLVETVYKSTKTAISETKLFIQFMKWKRENK